MKSEQVEAHPIIPVEFNDIPAIRTSEIVKLKPAGLELRNQLEKMSAKPILEQCKGDINAGQAICDSMNLAKAKLKQVVKFTEDCKLAATKPLRDAVAEINTTVKPITKKFEDVIEKAELVIREWDSERDRIAKEEEAERQRKIYEAEQERQREIERRKKISQAKGGDGLNITPIPPPLPIPKAQPVELTRSTTYRTRWDYDLVDFSEVPNEFKLLNETKIREAMRLSRDKDGVPKVNIPGIKWVQVKDIVG